MLHGSRSLMMVEKEKALRSIILYVNFTILNFIQEHVANEDDQLGTVTHSKRGRKRRSWFA